MQELKIVILSFILFAIYKLYNIQFAHTSAPVLPETWWGPGSKNESGNDALSEIKPFKIVFSDEIVEDLKLRLKNTRTMAPALEGTGWSYGVDGSYLPTIVDYWLNEYNFKERETYLNQYPHYITNIQGLEIHYLHVKPKSVVGKRVLPLLLQHGWPGSVVEFYKIIPMLTTPREEYDFVFEVIVPSLPGFGFSSAAVKPGLGSPQMAVVLKNLMLRLGFKQFYIQGGDWGAITGTNLAALYPHHVLGLHLNMCIELSLKNAVKSVLYSFAPSFLLPPENQHLMYPLKDKWSGLIKGFGYFYIQATKPDTVGVGSSDSPAALAAYILEKFSLATNRENLLKKDGGLFEKFSPDELIDNLMMYWVPNSATTAMRIYAETYSSETLSLDMKSVQVTVPTICAQFPQEIAYQPINFLKDRYPNMLRETIMPRGGHFAALEEPALLANDVWKSIVEMERFNEIEIQKEEGNRRYKH